MAPPRDSVPPRRVRRAWRRYWRVAEAFEGIETELYDPATGESEPSRPEHVLGEVTDGGLIVVPAGTSGDYLEAWLDGWRCANRLNRKV